jgi:hypothetical protein
MGPGKLAQPLNAWQGCYVVDLNLNTPFHQGVMGEVLLSMGSADKQSRHHTYNGAESFKRFHGC